MELPQAPGWRADAFGMSGHAMEDKMDNELLA